MIDRHIEAFDLAGSVNGLQILGHGLAELDGEWNHRHVRPSYSRLYYILDGSGFVETESETVLLTSGKTVLIPAGLTLHYGCPSRMTQLYFHVSMHAPDGYDLFSRVGHILTSDAAIEDLGENYASGELLRETLARCRVEADIMRFAIQAGLAQTLAISHSTFLNDVFRVVSENLRASITIAEIAREMNMSISALTKRFRREFGSPIGRYIDEMVLQEIIRKLTSTEDSIAAISDSLSFCDPFYLSRFFTERIGMSPTAYRRHQRNQI